LFLRDRGPTEVGGFGISAADDLLVIEEFVLVQQTCSEVTVRFDDASVADFFDSQVDQGRRPEQFGRVWIHTHPGKSPRPSLTDEATFARCFGATDWSVMFILAREGQAYARLQFQAGPRGDPVLPAEVDFGRESPATAAAWWDEEYRSCVTVDVFGRLESGLPKLSVLQEDPFRVGPLPVIDPELEFRPFRWPLETDYDRFFQPVCPPVPTGSSRQAGSA
jgi:hypothetical protein